MSQHYLPKLEYLWIGQGTLIETGLPGSKLLSKTAIRHLRIPGYYLWAILQDSFDRSTARPHNLDTLELDTGCFHPTWLPTYIDIDGIWDAVAEGSLGNLRRLLVHPGSSNQEIQDRDRREFSEYLKALAREDGNKARFTEDQVGLQTFV